MDRSTRDSDPLPGPEDPRGVGALLDTAARARGDRTAIVSAEEKPSEATYVDLDRAARQAASRLRDAACRAARSRST